GPQIIGSQPQNVNLKMPPAPAIPGVIQSQNITNAPKFEPPPQGSLQKGFQSVIWSAHDDNDDDLRYAVYFRGESEKEWKLLKENLELRYSSFDTTSMADGAYYLKITASDATSNPQEQALTAQKESERFEVDNTPPVIEKLAATPTRTCAGNPCVYGAATKFTARDSGTSIERAQYSLDGGEWTQIAPVGNISDGKEESYEF